MTVTLQIDQLSTKEKISIMEALWDNLCQKSEDISSPAWHDKEKIGSRIANFHVIKKKKESAR